MGFVAKRLPLSALVLLGIGIPLSWCSEETPAHPIAIALERESRLIAGKARFQLSIQEEAIDQLPDKLKRAAMSMTLRTSPPGVRPSLGGLPDDQTVQQLVGKLMQELKKAAFIDCYWRGYDIFRIELKDANDGLLRTITCDGRWIDTGSGTLWDVRFLKEYRGAPPDLQEEFGELIWPYRLFSGLLFPISEGGRFDFRQLNA